MLIGKMEQMMETDQEEHQNNRPAIHKLRMLAEVEDFLCQVGWRWVAWGGVGRALGRGHSAVHRTTRHPRAVRAGGGWSSRCQAHVEECARCLAATPPPLACSRLKALGPPPAGWCPALKMVDLL